MAADWEEVKRLAADFQKAQLGSTVQKLSERNCIEIVKKLLELKLIDVIFTNDGKEYVTPQRLQKEIVDELIFHGGRVNLADLPQIIGVDFSHIEAKAVEFSRSEPDVRILLGQLITGEYLDHIAEEVNEKLQQAGQITIAELTKQYDLPGDFLEENIHERLQTIIQGHADTNDSRTIFTDSYVAQHKARIQGVLSALTRPVPISTLISHFKFPEKLFYSVAENLIKGGRLAGSLSGGRSERALYIPDLYAKSQSEWVDAFYRQNGYLEYDSLSRLGIPDPKAYITKRYAKESLTFLRSCCVGKAILTQVEASIEEAFNSGSWVDVMPLLPSVFNSGDCQQIISTAIKSLPKQSLSLRVFCNSVVVSDVFMNSCLEIFEPLMKEKAHEDIMKYPQYFAASHTVVTKNSSKKEETTSRSKTDKKEERRKKGGKAGGGTQGRETKIRSVKKKYHTVKGGEDSGSDEEALDSQAKDNKITELEFMNVAEIEKKLEEIPSINECLENLVSALAEQFYRPLSKRYQDIAKSIYVTVMFNSGSSRRKLHAEFQEKASTLLNHIYMFEKGIKLFSEVAASLLVRHILKTLCTDISNMCVNYLAHENGICTDTDLSTDLSAEARQNIIKKLPEDVRQHTSKLHVALTSKTLEDFQTNIEIVLGAGVCDAMYRKIDKKAERALLSIHRQSLLTQLSDATDPALCLHLAVLLIFQMQTNHMLHASGKFVPLIITFLQKHLPYEIHKVLAESQVLVIQRITTGENAEETEKLDAALKEQMPKIKETAISYKKGLLSDVQ